MVAFGLLVGAVPAWSAHAPEHRRRAGRPLKESHACALLINFGCWSSCVAVLAGWVLLPWPGAVLLAVLRRRLAAARTRRGRQALSVADVGISTLKAAARLVGGDRRRHRRRRRRAGRAAGDGRGLRRDAARDRQRRHGDRDARRVGVGGVVGAGPRQRRADRADRGHRARRQGRAARLAASWSSPPTCRSRAAPPDEEGSVQLRGVGEQAWAVRPQVKIVEGRRFTPGLRELIVGRGAARQFAGAARRPGGAARREDVEGRRASSRRAMRSSRRSGPTPTSSPTPTGAAAAAPR